MVASETRSVFLLDGEVLATGAAGSIYSVPRLEPVFADIEPISIRERQFCREKIRLMRFLEFLLSAV
jgi:hypothetical protein